MSENQQKLDYLDEHLPYMLKMLRYTYRQMHQKQHFLAWNAHFESFAVHARNLVRFLNNSDTGNFKAHDFVPNYRARPGTIQGAMQKLDRQVFHLGKERPRTPIDKFDTEHARDVQDWIEKNFAEFRSKLDDNWRSLFNDRKADPAPDNALYVSIAVDQQQACTATVSTSTSIGDTFVFSIVK